VGPPYRNKALALFSAGAFLFWCIKFAYADSIVKAKRNTFRITYRKDKLKINLRNGKYQVIALPKSITNLNKGIIREYANWKNSTSGAFENTPEAL
jgi:hypothetical protein